MNCPSRTDESVLDEHPTWNQNPPDLAADLTTRQDLNGIANLREHRKGSDGLLGSSADAVDRWQPVTRPPEPGPGAALAVPWPNNRHAPHAKMGNGGEGHARLQTSLARPVLGLPVSWGRAAWVSSVVLSSVLCFSIGRFWEAKEGRIAKESVTYVNVPHRKRASTCPVGGGVDEAKYNTPLHVGALFIILFVSTLACSFPMLATKFPGLRLSTRFFFVVRHFGTGVLIATAFVHLLPTAFIMLGDPCLSSFWTDDYPAMPGAIALAGIFLVVMVEMVFHPSRQLYAPPGKEEGASGGAGAPESGGGGGNVSSVREMGQLAGNSSSIGRRLSHIVSNEDAEQIAAPDVDAGKEQVDVENSQSGDSAPILTPEQKLRKEIMQCMLLEVGILFHSVFIGMALSVSIGNEFIILLIAIAFHQTFEGLALGARIASIVWPQKTLQPWFMALAYGCTTPVGQAIGLAIHSLYSPGSEVGLILVGTMNAISSGLLTFASLVELLSEDFLSDESWKILRGRKRVSACLLVFSGAFFMSLVGAWA